jgi:hypothetical protein
MRGARASKSKVRFNLCGHQNIIAPLSTPSTRRRFLRRLRQEQGVGEALREAHEARRAHDGDRAARVEARTRRTEAGVAQQHLRRAVRDEARVGPERVRRRAERLDALSQ